MSHAIRDVYGDVIGWNLTAPNYDLPLQKRIHEALLISAVSTKDPDGKLLAESLDVAFAGRMAAVLVESFAQMGLKVVEA